MRTGHRTTRCTLITPLRNEADNVGRVWASILKQQRLPDEWIICDNGSTDGTYEWLLAQVAESPFPVHVLSLPGRTIAEMLNIAIAQAESDVIACCHGGTRIPPAWLAQLLAPMDRDPSVDAVAGLWEAYGETDFERWYARTVDTGPSLRREELFLPASRSLAFKRRAWTAVGGFPEWLPKFGEDTLFAIRLRATGMRMPVARSAVVGWRPKSKLGASLRQLRLFTEADACMGLLGVRPRLVAGPHVWLLGGSVVALASGSLVAGLALVAVFTLVDYLRMRRLTRVRTLGEYIYWGWLAAGSQLIGAARGIWLRRTGRVHAPATDQRAVAWYRAALRSGATMTERENSIPAQLGAH